MDTNIINVNDEVFEATEEIVTASSGKGFKIAAGIGLTALVGVIAYKYVVKPMLVKIKAEKEQQTINMEAEELQNVEIIEESENEE